MALRDIILLGDSMKCLTIREPWGSLIINGYKEYEFRSWQTLYRGKILIHTSQRVEKKYCECFRNYNLNYLPGNIIGEAELVDVIKVDHHFNEILKKKDNIVYGQNDHTSIYAWKLVNIKKYNTPIPCKGKLGLWNYKENDINGNN